MVTIYKSSRRFATKSVLYFFRYNYFCITIGKAKLCGATFVFNINFKMFLIEYSCLANTLWQNVQVWSEYIQS